MRKYILVCLYVRRGVEQDYGSGQLVSLSSRARACRAQFNLGYAYRNGEGVEQDYVEAVSWFRLAAEQGNAGAQDNLGYAYRNGEVLSKTMLKRSNGIA